MKTTPSTKPVFSTCIACEILTGQKKIPGGSLLRTNNFDIHQDFAVPIPGFLIIVPVRHVNSVEDFTNEEATEFGLLLKTARKAVTQSLGIELVHLLQDENSPHFHLAMLPRYDWMKELHGEKAQSIKPIMEYAKEHMDTDAQWDIVIAASEQIRQQLHS